MKKPSFFEGVAVALIAAFVCAAGAYSLSMLFFSDMPIYLLLAGISCAYIVYLLWRSNEKTGRVSALLIWFLLTITAFVFSPSLIYFVLLQMTFIWLIRALYFHNSVLAALLDLSLFALSLMVSAWAWYNTQSVFVAAWSFFLTQALFVLIPSHPSKSHSPRASGASAERFDIAHRNAEDAIRKLATQ